MLLLYHIAFFLSSPCFAITLHCIQPLAIFGGDSLQPPKPPFLHDFPPLKYYEFFPFIYTMYIYFFAFLLWEHYTASSLNKSHARSRARETSCRVIYVDLIIKRCQRGRGNAKLLFPFAQAHWHRNFLHKSTEKYKFST